LGAPPGGVEKGAFGPRVFKKCAGGSRGGGETPGAKARVCPISQKGGVLSPGVWGSIRRRVSF